MALWALVIRDLTRLSFGLFGFSSSFFISPSSLSFHLVQHFYQALPGEQFVPDNYPINTGLSYQVAVANFTFPLS